MRKFQRLWTTAVLLAICLAAERRSAFADSKDPVEQILNAAQQAMLDRHYRQAVHILQTGLKDHPADNRVRLGLGRACVMTGAEKRAIRLLREVVREEPDNRPAKVELAFALGYSLRYEDSNAIFRELILADAGDEASAIGLASNLLHQQQIAEARSVADRALSIHPNSLRLQEYKDRIESGKFSGEEREPEFRRNMLESGTDYFNDSAGNHSWESSQRVDFGLGRSFADRILLEQQFQHSRDDLFEAVQTYTEQLRWRPRESLLVHGGGGAVRFDNADVHSIYEASVAVQPIQHSVLGATFARVPVMPNAEASEHRLTAQGWEAYGGWTYGRWQINARGSRQHYSDTNIGSRQSAEITRGWGPPRLTFETGYRYRRESFDQDLAHGYFSPNEYQSHLAGGGAILRAHKWHRGELLALGGAESVASGKAFSPAWEIEVRNQVLLGNWTLELDYSKYHLVQDTGAFRADAGRFEFGYRF